MNHDNTAARLAGIAALVCLAGCSPPADEDTKLSAVDAASLDAGFARVLAEHRVATLGAGIVRGGELAWSGHYGEQAPGVPATETTMFNVGSITKTVTAELALRLASDATISLDEPMSAHWIDPDLADDPRHRQLTPRLALSHRTGFPNWRYTDPEFRLRFIADPGSAFGYSGEGMDYVARFLENKTGESFDALVTEHVFEPIGIENMSITREDRVVERLAQPVDEDGNRHAPYCSGPGSRYCLGDGDWSAADELATTVEDYARFMIAVMHGRGVDPALARERLAVQTSTADDPVLGCKLDDTAACPREQGYGLGWELFVYDDETVVSHGGSDWSERAIAYFDPVTHDGVVLFINGPASTSVEALIDGMRLLDPDSKIATLYRGWVDAYLAARETDG